MTRKNEGAAHDQANRAEARPAGSRQPRISVAELEERREFSQKVNIVAFVMLGALGLYAFMFLACAY